MHSRGNMLNNQKSNKPKNKGGKQSIYAVNDTQEVTKEVKHNEYINIMGKFDSKHTL